MAREYFLLLPLGCCLPCCWACAAAQRRLCSARGCARRADWCVSRPVAHAPLVSRYRYLLCCASATACVRRRVKVAKKELDAGNKVAKKNPGLVAAVDAVPEPPAAAPASRSLDGGLLRGWRPTTQYHLRHRLLRAQSAAAQAARTAAHVSSITAESTGPGDVPCVPACSPVRALQGLPASL